jgi:hypothetical protein
MVHYPITVLLVAEGSGDPHAATQALTEVDPTCVVLRTTALEPALDRLPQLPYPSW